MHSSKELKDLIIGTSADDVFIDIYKDKTMIPFQKERYVKAIDKFVRLYKDGELALFSAPGRSEIMGNHTDHQHGEVLCAAINLDAIAVVKKTDDDIIKIVSGEYPEIKINVNDTVIPAKGGSPALVAGICQGLKDRGYKVGGFEAYITSNVAVGAGMSSSAAFETLIGTILSYNYNDGKVSDTEIAIIGQFAENVYFGKPCGLMDQMACSVGNLVHIDFRDEKNPGVEKIEYDLSENGYSLCITDTKGSHANLTDEYAAIPAEMKEVAAFFGKEYLLDVKTEDILSNAVALREKTSDRAILRAIHFAKENERVKGGAEALKKNDTDTFLEYIRESGNSSFEYLQNVYSVKDTSSQSLSLALAISSCVLDKKKEAYRVHGGGFAGTIQAFVLNENVSKYKAAMESVYGADSCHVLKIRKYGGIKVFK